jgi:hypothetical protein
VDAPVVEHDAGAHHPGPRVGLEEVDHALEPAGGLDGGVAVELDDELPASAGERGVERGDRARGGLLDERHPRPAAGVAPALEDRDAVVRGAVVDDDQLDVGIGGVRGEPLEDEIEDRPVVAVGEDERDGRARHLGGLSGR